MKAIGKIKYNIEPNPETGMTVITFLKDDTVVLTWHTSATASKAEELVESLANRLDDNVGWDHTIHNLRF